METLKVSGEESQKNAADDYVGQQRAVDTRRTILEEAARLFADKGYDGCSTRDIAAAAGVSHANIRYHFGDKETLWLKVIKFLIAESYHGAELSADLARSCNPTEIFREHTRNSIEFFALHSELPRIIHFESMLGSARYEKVRDLVGEMNAERVSHILAMQENGVVNPKIDPQLLNAFLGGALTNIFVVNPDINSLSSFEKEAIIEQYTELIISLVSK